MKTAAFVLLLLALVPAQDALAHRHGRVHFGSDHSCCDPPAHFASRHDLGTAHLAITTEDGSANLVLTRRVVAVQLSDRVLHKLDREIRQEKDEDDGFLADVIKSAVLGSVRSLLDHSFECPIYEVRDAEYRNGRLILTTEDGDRLFDGLDVNDEEVLANFSERDARAFVREFNRLKGRGY